MAIITGAAIGIGFEIGKQFSSSPALVVLNDIDGEGLEKDLATIKNLGEKSIGVQGNSGDMNIIEQLISTAEKEYGQLGFVIANAGITTFGDFVDYKLEDFQVLPAVNLQGSFFLAQAATKQFIKQKTKGTGHFYVFRYGTSSTSQAGGLRHDQGSP